MTDEDDNPNEVAVERVLVSAIGEHGLTTIRMELKPLVIVLPDLDCKAAHAGCVHTLTPDLAKKLIGPLTAAQL